MYITQRSGTASRAEDLLSEYLIWQLLSAEKYLICNGTFCLNLEKNMLAYYYNVYSLPFLGHEKQKRNQRFLLGVFTLSTYLDNNNNNNNKNSI